MRIDRTGEKFAQRLKRFLLSTSVCLATAGCLAPPSVVLVNTGSAPPPPVRLDGILSQSAGPVERIRVLFVHGMGTGAADYCALAKLMAHLATALDVRQRPVAHPYGACDGLIVPMPTYIAAPAPTPLAAQLFTYRFANADNSRKVQFSFLLWAPLTDRIKMETLAEDAHPSWALLTGFAKGFLQTHVADVVLYGGTYRKVMRPVVEQALCIFVGGQPQPDPTQCRGGSAEPRTVLITHSLGGYMLMDAIADISAAHSRPTAAAAGVEAADVHDAAAQTLARTDLVFMLANQLALLDLTTLDQYPPPTIRASSGAAAENFQAGRILRAFRRHWDHYHRIGGRRRQIVAISDPNDILSYLVSSADLPGSTGSTVVANVYLGVAGNWFDLFASPFSAHLNYLTDDKVATIIMCGMTGSVINNCI